MSHCKCCGTVMISSSYNHDDIHTECFAERSSRILSSLCMYCGKSDNGKNSWCNSCGRNGTYRDYPGYS